MTISELIYELQRMPQDAEIRLAMQPAWPFEYSIGGVVLVSSNESEGFDDREHEEEAIVYLSEGSQIGYLSDEAREELGW